MLSRQCVYHFRKLPNIYACETCGMCWNYLETTGFLLGFFQGGRSQKFFKGTPPLNFPGQTIPGGGGNIFKEYEIFTLES